MVWIFIWKCRNVTSQLTEGGDDAEHSFLSLRLAPWQGGRHHLLQPAGGLPFCKGAHGELSSSALLSSSKTWAPRPGRQLDSQKRWADKGVPRVPSIHPRWAAKGKAVPLIWPRRGSRVSGPEIKLKEVLLRVIGGLSMTCCLNDLNCLPRWRESVTGWHQQDCPEQPVKRRDARPGL